MLTRYEANNHLRPVWRAFDLAGHESTGRSEAMTLEGAEVECLGEKVTTQVVIHIDVDQFGGGTLRLDFGDAPATLRSAMREAMARFTSLIALPEVRWPHGVPFAIVDGETRCEIDPQALTITEMGRSESGPIALTLAGAKVRALIPWPVVP